MTKSPIIHSAKFMFVLLMALVVQGCISQHQIHLNEDGSAVVSSTNDGLITDSVYYKTSFTNNFSFQPDGISVKYDLSDIDLLDSILSPAFKKGALQFRLSEDTLLITQNIEFVWTDDYKKCCGILIEMSFEKKVKEVFSNNPRVKLRNNILTINNTIRAFNKRKLTVKIIFE